MDGINHGIFDDDETPVIREPSDSVGTIITMKNRQFTELVHESASGTDGMQGHEWLIRKMFPKGNEYGIDAEQVIRNVKRLADEKNTLPIVILIDVFGQVDFRLGTRLLFE